MKKNENLLVSGAIKIYGYYIPRNSEDGLQVYNRAKKETLINMQKQMVTIDNLTFKDYLSIKSKGFRV